MKFEPGIQISDYSVIIAVCSKHVMM